MSFFKGLTPEIWFSLIIPVVISAIGVLINSFNTGKKIERYKRILDSKDISYTKSIEVYEEIRNLLVDNIFEGCRRVDFIDDRILDIKDLLRKNEFYIPDKIYEKMDEIVNNVDEYNDRLDERHDLKFKSDGVRNKVGDKQRQRISEIDSMEYNTLRMINKKFRKLKKIVHKKYNLF